MHLFLLICSLFLPANILSFLLFFYPSCEFFIYRVKFLSFPLSFYLMNLFFRQMLDMVGKVFYDMRNSPNKPAGGESLVNWIGRLRTAGKRMLPSRQRPRREEPAGESELVPAARRHYIKMSGADKNEDFHSKRMRRRDRSPEWERENGNKPSKKKARYRFDTAKAVNAKEITAAHGSWAQPHDRNSSHSEQDSFRNGCGE